MGLFRRDVQTDVSALTLGAAWHDRALDAGVDEVGRGHLLAGVALLGETRSQPDLRTLRSAALAQAAIGRSGDILALLRESPDNPDVALWLGDTLIAEAWAARTDKRARHVTAEQFKMFHSILRTAREPLMAAARMLPDDPAPWSALQRFARGMQLPVAEQDAIWEDIVARHPTLFAGAWGRVQNLATKWGRSDEEMLAFARQIAQTAPAGDPVVAALPLAHAEVFHTALSSPSVSRRDRVKLFAGYFSDQSVRDELGAASDRWLSAARPHPYDADAHHLFGFAFYLGRDKDRARTHLRAAGDRVPEAQPWAYIGEPLERCAYARQRLGLR